MFDCVLPTRNARHGTLYTWKSDNLDKDFYQKIIITNEKYKEDFSPIDPNCGCEACQNYSKAYLRHLFMVSEPLAHRLATLHNLRFYLDLMKRIRQE